MSKDNLNALDATALALNEDAKADRKRRATESPAPDEALEQSDQPDPEELQSAGLQAMQDAAENMDLESGTLVGDLAAGILEIVKNVQKPWSAHSQHEKRDLVAKIDHIAANVARQAVDIIAADDQIAVKAVLEKIAIGDKTLITLKLGAMPEDEMAAAIQSLFHAQKKSVMIVTADPDRYMSRRSELIEPDQEGLPFDAGSDAPQRTDSDIVAQARELILSHRKASIGFLQSELTISHNAAVRALADLCDAGDIAAADEAGNHEVLMPARDDSDLAGDADE